jgi:predicted transcriptional regulator
VEEVAAVNRLGELERKVMDVLWDSIGTPLTGRQIAEKLPDRAYTTVLTVLDRLRRKRLVDRLADTKVHLFLATDSRESYMAELMVEAMGHAGNRDAVLVRFAKSVSPNEAAVLRGALNDVPAEGKTGKR